MTIAPEEIAPGILPPEDWQLEDIDYLAARPDAEGSANWSEMGGKKTSTGLWLAQKKLQDIEAPSVLIITTRTGKGTFFQLGPGILGNKWTIFNVDTKGISVLRDGKELRLPPTKLKFVPKKFNFPTVVVTHYNIFSKSNQGKFEVDDNSDPLIDPEDGSFFMKPWTQADHIVNRHWNFVWLDEAHRIKDRDARWTKTIKRLKVQDGNEQIRHVSTGTGFINRPDETWRICS